MYIQSSIYGFRHVCVILICTMSWKYSSGYVVAAYTPTLRNYSVYIHASQDDEE